MLSSAAIYVLALATVRSCTAHMVLDKPKPYGSDTLNNSPLDSSGLDFPCKQREGVYDLTEMNYWAVGEVQTISFLGSAVHGGGSCQFSVTTDRQPTKASQWKVIHSVIGGCPASIQGNFITDSLSHESSSFDLVLPEGMPSGLYTFAWTWFNREGAREMYMNCAPISVSGGSDNSSFLATLPDMFVANLPSTECGTVEKFDYAFPQPGDSVTTGNGAKVMTTLSGTGCVSMTRLGAGSATLHSVDAVAQAMSDQSGVRTERETLAAVTTATALATAIVIATGKVPGGVLEAAPATNTVTPVAPSPLTLSSSATSVIQPQTHEISSDSLEHTDTCIPCAEGKSVVCLDGEHFGLCDRGCAIPQLLAAGTFCSHGSILRRNVRGSSDR
jgi:hypothetical protein